MNPNINKEFLHSEIVYKEYLKRREDDINRKKKSDSKKKRQDRAADAGNRYADVN